MHTVEHSMPLWLLLGAIAEIQFVRPFRSRGRFNLCGPRETSCKWASGKDNFDDRIVALSGVRYEQLAVISISSNKFFGVDM